MSKEIQQKKKALITKLFNEHPEIREAKKFTGIIVLAWFLTRVFAVATEYYCVLQGVLPFSIANLAALLVMALFVWTIYQGIRTLAYLPILGSVIMIIQTFTEQLYSLLSAQYILSVRIYAAAFIVTAYAQLFLMLFLLSNEKSTMYFDAMKKIAVQLGLADNSVNRHGKR